MTGVPQAIASTAGRPNPSSSDGRHQRVRPAVKEHEIVVGDEARQDHAIVQTVPRDRRADLGDVGVEDVVNVAGEHEHDVGGGRLGEGLDQPEQVLVRAQAADIEEKTRIVRDRRAGQGRRRRPGRRPGAERSGRGLR